jgi:solute carrier family 25 folate transporter 32
MVLMTNPVWLIKTRMQLQMKRAGEKHNIKPYRGMFDAARTITRDEGYLALYKGSGPALLLTSHGGVQFVVYEYLRKHFHFNRVKRDNAADTSVWQRLELSSGYLAIGAIAKM